VQELWKVNVMAAYPQY